MKNKTKAEIEEHKFIDRWNECIATLMRTDQNFTQQTEVAKAIGVYPDRLFVWRNYGSIPTAQNIIIAVRELHFNPLFLYHNIGSPLADPNDFKRDFVNMAKLKQQEQALKMIKQLTSLNGN